LHIVDKHGLAALKAVDTIARPSKLAPNAVRRGLSEANYFDLKKSGRGGR